MSAVQRLTSGAGSLWRKLLIVLLRSWTSFSGKKESPYVRQVRLKWPHLGDQSPSGVLFPAVMQASVQCGTDIRTGGRTRGESSSLGRKPCAAQGFRIHAL
ncbi:hypothetical protein NPIL_506781 [Nephila pilipes]|uniref:Uncharacterized protein n=1 Tax=Nephila pilipes TaxID=299642 RepID=A0A8X6NYE0_NEPPI|nr:hypothetical protein NPIL_506781 [Nephila pilipes]